MKLVEASRKKAEPRPRTTTSLPEGFELDPQKVGLGNDPKGIYVGLVQRRKGREEPVSDAP